MNQDQFRMLNNFRVKPEPFTPGEAAFWTDTHIASQMLAFHLDPNVEAASRKPETIDESCAWIIQTLALQHGAKILDLGCGPGLYASRLARLGMRVSGVDFSQNSIEYARRSAREQELDIDYRCLDSLDLQDENRFDAALLIYGDYYVLSPGERSRLLANIRRALKSGGSFILDVSTPTLHEHHGLKNSWYAAPEGGFWKPGPHLVLQEGFGYPELSIYLDQYVVIEPDDKISVYRNWFQDFTADSLRAELRAGGFKIESLWNDLSGNSYSSDGEWIGSVSMRT